MCTSCSARSCSRVFMRRVRTAHSAVATTPPFRNSKQVYIDMYVMFRSLMEPRL